jgi:5-(carboxyamino)imidazole ribonucleotide synthase
MRVAILGGGQLARMLALSAHRLGIEPVVLDPKPDAPASPVAHQVLGALDDPGAWPSLLHCDVATAELDHAPPSALEWLSRHIPVRPTPRAFAIAGDRLREKRLFRELGIETAPFAAIDGPEDLVPALEGIGLPAVLKTRHAGYDGRGQRVIREPGQALPAWQSLGGAPALLEGLVPFSRELSLLAVRGLDGDTRFWTPSENVHARGILRRSSPLELPCDHPLPSAARRAVGAVLSALDYVGVLAIEFFEREGRLIANELAPRVHNSGHWTEVGAETSQFENHLRAIVGWPLGGTAPLAPTTMINLIGELPPLESLLSLPGAQLQLYGKAPARDRKLGHLNLRGERAGQLASGLARLQGDPDARVE